MSEPRIKARKDKDLTDEECYLAAILMDLSGIDIAEFLWHEPLNDDGCYRAYPAQWQWWRDRSPNSIDQMARSMGKTESINVRAHAFLFNYPGQEMVIIAPESTHVDPIAERIEHRIKSSRLMSEMMSPSRGKGGMTHRPFKVIAQNGANIYTKLPKRDGSGVKGIHPVALEVDEAQDLQQAVFEELPEVVRTEIDGAYSRFHGVSKGLRDSFYAMTQPGSGFKVHRLTAMSRPHWSNEDREFRVKRYGTEFSPDYKRNVYGLHGDATNRIFVLHRLMKCQVRTDETPEHPYLAEYHHKVILGDEVEGRAGVGNLEDARPEHSAVAIAMMDLPPKHVATYKTFWVGMDVGLVNDPNEILVFAEYLPSAAERKRDAAQMLAVPAEGLTRFKLLTRIQVRGVPTTVLADLVTAMIDHYRPRAFAMDAGGNGLSIWQILQHRAGKARFAMMEATDEPEVGASKALTAIKGYKFGSNVFVGIDEEKVVDLGLDDPQEILSKCGIKQDAKDWATDILRNEWVDAERFMFPDDDEVLNDLNGQTWQPKKGSMDPYGRRTYSGVGGFHILDAARFAALGWRQGKIEAYQKQKPERMPMMVAF